jgi:hypothetical protein
MSYHITTMESKVMNSCHQIFYQVDSLDLLSGHESLLSSRLILSLSHISSFRLSVSAQLTFGLVFQFLSLIFLPGEIHPHTLIAMCPFLPHRH